MIKLAKVLKESLNESNDLDSIAQSEFGMDYDQLGPNEQEWCRDELDNRGLAECGGCERDGVDYTHGHDHEASMADGELRDLISNASKLQNMIQPGDELPGWVSAYITLASDYMHSVAEYMTEKQAEMGNQEEPELPSFAVYEGLDKNSNYETVAEKLGAARIPCRLKEVDGKLTLELGFNYPDELVDKIYDVLGIKLADTLDICADQGGGTVTRSQRIAGGPKKY